MRKYDILGTIFGTSDGITPKEISKKLNIALPNVYTYLGSLVEEGVIQRDASGKCTTNKTNDKLSILLNLQAMAPDKFHTFISPSFKSVLQKLCKSAKVTRHVFSSAEINRLEIIAIPSRIVLRLSKRPASYCLKINEALVSTLLDYHGLRPVFKLADFNRAVDSATFKRTQGITKTGENAPEVMKLCEDYYAKGEDISLFSKARNFVPDERLSDLLKKHEQTEKEYLLFLNGLDDNLRKSILEQWEKKYIYNTNSIEGNTMSEDQVNEYFKTGKSPLSVSKRELHETNNMRHALGFLNLKRQEDISEELILELHYEVQKDIDESAGKYKNIYNYVKLNSPTTPPQHVRERMKLLLEWYRQNKDGTHPFLLAVVFHMQFEMIHPFADGNGRVGRLLMNHILLQRGKLPLTILEKTKQNYYNALANRSIQQFLLYALTSFMEEYRR